MEDKIEKMFFSHCFSFLFSSALLFFFSSNVRRYSTRSSENFEAMGRGFVAARRRRIDE